MLPAAGNRHQFVGPGTEFLPKVFDQQVDAAVFSHHPRQRLAADRLGRGKNHRLDPQHPFLPTQFLRQIFQLPIKQACACDARPVLAGLFGCRGSGHRHNPKIRKEERPESSRTASKLSSRSNSRLAAQRDSFEPGAEAGTASSVSNRRITGAAPLSAPSAPPPIAVRPVDRFRRRSAALPQHRRPAPGRLLLGKPVRPAGRDHGRRWCGRRVHTARAAAMALASASSALRQHRLGQPKRHYLSVRASGRHRRYQLGDHEGTKRPD